MSRCAVSSIIATILAFFSSAGSITYLTNTDVGSLPSALALADFGSHWLTLLIAVTLAASIAYLLRAGHVFEMMNRSASQTAYAAYHGTNVNELTTTITIVTR